MADNWYSIPDVGIERIRNKSNAARLGGQTVTPQMLSAAYEAEMKAVQDEATKRRGQDLESQRYNDAINQRGSQFQQQMAMLKSNRADDKATSVGKSALGFLTPIVQPMIKNKLGGLFNGTPNGASSNELNAPANGYPSDYTNSTYPEVSADDTSNYAPPVDDTISNETVQAIGDTSNYAAASGTDFSATDWENMSDEDIWALFG